MSDLSSSRKFWAIPVVKGLLAFTNKSPRFPKRGLFRDDCTGAHPGCRRQSGGTHALAQSMKLALHDRTYRKIVKEKTPHVIVFNTILSRPHIHMTQLNFISVS